MPKKRSQSCYNRKFKKVADWYNRLLKCRGNPKGNNFINPNTKQEPKRRPLRELDYYLEKIKKPNN